MGIVVVGGDLEDEDAWVVDGCELLIGGGGDVGDEDDVDVDDDYVEYEDSSLKRHGDCWWWW